MRKRLIVGTAVALAVAVTGTFAAQMLKPRANFVIDDRTGHNWEMTSDYRGEVRLYDPQNHMIGTAGNAQFGSTLQGTVVLDVSGAHFVLHDGERREIRDGKNTLLGYAVLVPFTDKPGGEEMAQTPEALLAALRKSEEDEMKHGGMSGSSASPLGVNGYDKQLDASWKVRGRVSVTVFNAAGQQISQGKGGLIPEIFRGKVSQEVFTPAVPRVEITVHGKMQLEQGYGTHKIKDAKGKLLLRMEIMSLSDTEGDAAKPAHSDTGEGADKTAH